MEPDKSKYTVWWIKKDFRISDNSALIAAHTSDTELLPIYLFEPHLLKQSGHSELHTQAIKSSLYFLQTELRKFGVQILLLHREAEEAFQFIHRHYPIAAVHSHMEIGYESTYARDRRMKEWFKSNQIPWVEHAQNGVIRGLKNRDKRENRWRNFINKPSELPPTFIPHDTELQKRILKDSDLSLNQPYTNSQRQIINESEASRTLESFLHQRGYRYSSGISSPNSAFHVGSRLSPHLAWGTISLKEVFQRTIKRIQSLKHEEEMTAKRWKRSLQAFQSRLHWHDHFIQRLETEPEMEFHALHPSYREQSNAMKKILYGIKKSTLSREHTSHVLAKHGSRRSPRRQKPKAPSNQLELL